MEDTKKPNYKIYTLDEKHNKKVVETFYAENDASALSYLKDHYSNKNDGKTYYWGRHYSIQVRHDDGTVSEYDNHIDAIIDKHGHDSIWKKIKDFFAIDVAYYLIDKPKDFWYWVKDIAFLLKNKIERRAAWSFDWYLLEEIEKTLPRLLTDKVGISPLFLDMAIIELHGTDPNFDLAKYNEEYCCKSYPTEVEELADKIMADTYNEILLHIKLFKYYSLAFDEFDDAEFDKKWHHTLPVKEGTYDEYDYTKLMELETKEWNTIWDMMKKYGRDMWD